MTGDERNASSRPDDPAPGDAGDAPPAGGAADADLIGTVLAGRYRILRKLGEGAMGAVYLGEHVKIGRQDAIKVLRGSLAGDAEAIARFLRGARNVSLIRHPNVCTIYDFSDTADGLQFLAMEFIPGETLKDILQRDGSVPLERAIGITTQAAEALQAAHDAGIVHRDLKPANIMIAPGRDGADVVKVVDFDIAKGSQDAEGSEVTRLGFVVGTPEYMSPEQLMGERLDGRSDVYSLALVLFRMLTGTLPFRAESTQDVMVQRLTHDPLRLDEALPGRDFPPALQAALDRALARKAADRCPSAAEFAHDLAASVAAAPAETRAEAPSGEPLETAPAAGGDARASGQAAAGAAAQPPAAGATAELPETRLSTPLTGGAAAEAATGASGYPGSAGAGRQRTRLVAAASIVGVAGLLAVAWAVLADHSPDEPTPANGSAAVAAAPDTAAGASSAVADTDSVAVATIGGGGGGEPASPNRQADRPRGEPARPSPTGPDDAGASRPRPGRAGAGEAEPTPAIADPNETLWRQFESGRFDQVDSPAPRITLEAIRDTARAIWGLGGAETRDRAFAAYILGHVMLPLGDTAQGRVWAERAVDLCADCRGYSDLLEFYRSITR